MNLKKALDAARRENTQMNKWTVFVNGAALRAVESVTTADTVCLLHTSAPIELDEDGHVEPLDVKTLIRQINNHEVRVMDDGTKKVEEVGFDKKKHRVYLRCAADTFILSALLEEIQHNN